MCREVWAVTFSRVVMTTRCIRVILRGKCTFVNERAFFACWPRSPQKLPSSSVFALGLIFAQLARRNFPLVRGDPYLVGYVKGQMLLRDHNCPTFVKVCLIDRDCVIQNHCHRVCKAKYSERSR